MTVVDESMNERTPGERRDIAWIRAGLAVIAICLSGTVTMQAAIVQRRLHADVPSWLFIAYVVGAGLVCLLGLAITFAAASKRHFGEAACYPLFGAAAAGVWPLLAVVGIVWMVKDAATSRS